MCQGQVESFQDFNTHAGKCPSRIGRAIRLQVVNPPNAIFVQIVQADHRINLYLANQALGIKRSGTVGL